MEVRKHRKLTKSDFGFKLFDNETVFGYSNSYNLEFSENMEF